MDLAHSFEVPTDVGATWDHFGDIEALAECFPGAQVTSVEGDSFTGQAKVKLGPIALVYLGSGTIVEKDEAARRMRVEAKGKDKRGNGTAGATITLTMAEAADGGTSVEVLTDLSITGKPAQFGRGVMQDVSDKLLGQFVACLEERLSAPEPAPPADGPVSEPPTQVSTHVSGEPAAPRHARTAGDTPVGVTSGPPPRDDALDLGATVLPVLVRSYWKQALAVVAGLVLLRRLLRHR